MEACENYQKQSYRNRCRIYAADGVQNLNFPIVHSGGSISIPIREVLVDWSTPWLAKTKRCIDTAYRSSPFFDYYRDSLYALLDTRPETLWDLDMGIIGVIAGIAGARIYYVIFSWDMYKDNLLDIFNLREGGLAIYGGVIGAVIAVFVLARVKRLSPFQILHLSSSGHPTMRQM